MTSRRRSSQFGTTGAAALGFVALVFACTGARAPAPELRADGGDAGALSDAAPAERDGAASEAGALTLPPSKAPVISLATADSSVCALHADGTVSCWGSGFGTVPRRVPGLDAVAEIAAGARATVYARTTSGDVYGLHPSADSGALTKLRLPHPAIELSETCAVLDDRTVACWNYEEKIGLVPDLAHVSHVGSSFGAGCAAHDGKVSCWTPRAPDPDITLDGVLELAVASDTFRCARVKSGDVICWGLRAPSNLAMPVLPRIPVTPVSLGLRDAVSLSTDGSTLCAVRKDRSSVCVDARFSGPLVSRPGPRGIDLLRQSRGFSCSLDGGRVSCVGKNDEGQLGIGVPTFRATPASVEGVDDAIAIHAGLTWTCAVRRGGKVSCWGKVGETRSPTASELVGVRDVVELGGHVWPCFRRGDGTIGCYSVLPSGPKIAVVDAPKSEGFAVYFAGCSITSGAVSCWEGGHPGQYGDGTAQEPPRKGPGALGVTDAKKLALGPFHACVLRRTGEIVTYGDELTDDVLGGASAGLVLSPKPVPGFRASIDVAAGLSHCCAVRSDGHVDCFGDNREGELGDGTREPRASAVQVVGVERATAVASSHQATCALAEGGVFCWGHDRSILGPDASRPVRVGGLRDPIALAVGDHHACALSKDGTVACWGSTLEGESGGIVSGSFKTPQPVAF